MDISIYFSPSWRSGGEREWPAFTLGEATTFHGEHGMPELEGAQIAIFGLPDDPGHGDSRGCNAAPAAVREQLYALHMPARSMRIVDLGDLLPGHSEQDTRHALSEIVAELISMAIVPIILGGGQGHALAQYMAYERLERTANLVCIDPRFDLGVADQPLDSESYLGHIVLRRPSFLFNFSNLGYQTYLVDQPGIELMEKLYFDVHRLGELRGDITEAEPVLRNADMLVVDMNAVRASDAPGTTRPGPNGFHAEELCQLMRYAGVSEKISSVGIYEMVPKRDRDGVTAQLAAQMVWCFLDGYRSRTNDLPWLDRDRFTKFRVPIKGHEQDLVFYKSSVSDRWWMDVPVKPDHGARFERHHLVPCGLGDYRMACREEVPDRWWRTYQKLL